MNGVTITMAMPERGSDRAIHVELGDGGEALRTYALREVKERSRIIQIKDIGRVEDVHSLDIDLSTGFDEGKITVRGGSWKYSTRRVCCGGSAGATKVCRR